MERALFDSAQGWALSKTAKGAAAAVVVVCQLPSPLLLPLLVNFARVEVFKIRPWGSQHLRSRALIFVIQNESIVRVAPVIEPEPPTNVMSEAIAVIEVPLWLKWRIQFQQFKHSVLRKFPKGTLVRRAPAYEYRAAHCVGSILSVLGFPHWLELIVGLKHYWLSRFSIRLEHRAESTCRSPVELGRKIASVLKIDDYSSESVGFFGYYKFGYFPVRTANSDVGSLALGQRIPVSLVRFN